MFASMRYNSAFKGWFQMVYYGLYHYLLQVLVSKNVDQLTCQSFALTTHL